MRVLLPMLRVNSQGVSFQVWSTWWNHDRQLRQGFPRFILTLWFKPRLRLRRYR